MRIFVEERDGTPVSYEERLHIADEIAKLEEYKMDEQAIQETITSCIDLLGCWDRETELQCVEHDIYMMKKTLETDRVVIL